MADAPPDDAAQQQLEVVVRRAFAVEGGYLELNGIVRAATGHDLFDELGLASSPMKTVVESMRAWLVATGHGAQVLAELFLRLPGNVEMREWVARHCPALLARVPDSEFENARGAYERDRMDRRVRVIDVQLRAIGATVTLRGEHRALARLVIEKLDELTDYKAIHDVLHGLQMETLGELARIARPDILPVDRADSLTLQVERLRSAIEKIDGRFCGAENSAVSVGLRRKVVAALSQIVTVLTSEDPQGAQAVEVAEAAAGLLRAALRQQMSLFDSKLVEASDAIPFQRFAQLVRALPGPEGKPQSTGSGDPILASNVGDGFTDIETRLVRRRTVHGLWQQVESTLLNIEELLRGTGRAIELVSHWQNLEELVGELAGLSAEHGLLHMPRPEVAGAGPAALAAAVRSPTYLSRFGFFAGQARVRFQRADTALINDCEKLKRLQQPLVAMLGD